MAGALRPAVLLIVVASVLFLVDGYLDGVYPGGPGWGSDAYYGLGWTSYFFAVVNAFVAVLIARGSERTLALRIGLAAFFIFERPVSAVALGEKPIASLAIHMLTALVEVVILASTLRVWRLGHSFTDTDLSMLTLPSPATAAAGAGSGADPFAASVEAIPGPSGRRARFGFPRLALPRVGRRAPVVPAATAPLAEAPALKVREPMAVRVRTLSRSMTLTLGALSLLLALALVADGAVAGIVPGVTVDLASPAWLVYVFALVLLVVASRAVHGGRFAIRMLLAVALIYFLERAFTPFALRLTDPISLGLHVAAAFIALALALLSAAALRAAARPSRSPSAS